jgi:signal transduction histidine kinase
MKGLSRLNHFRLDNPLAMRLLALILLCSSLITLTATALQLYLDYRYDLSQIDDRIQQIEASSLDSLSNSLWVIDPMQIQLQLNGLEQLPDVHYLKLDTRFDEHFEAGSPPAPDIRLVTRHYPLVHQSPQGEQYPLGTLQIQISLEDIYQRLQDRVLVILASQGIKTFLVSAFILYIFWRLVSQHLSALARYASTLRLDNLDRPMPIRLDSRRSDDELGKVVTALDSMCRNLRESITRRTQAEQALAELNSELEARVRRRTLELEDANQTLNRTLETLRAAQQQLIESEKMAALGGLVAGVAHEISTPLGIGFTAASFLEQEARTRLQHKDDDAAQAAGPFSERQLSERRLSDRQFCENTLESSQLIRQHLERAAQLIKAFKQVSVDQSSEQRRPFNLEQYLNEILLSLRPHLKQQSPLISLECPPELTLHSYPGAFYQVMTNLLLNSLIHGFDRHRPGHIWIEVIRQADCVHIRYRDDGVGVAQEVQGTLFEPFVTTRRHQGCSGLGMHIVYNLVTQLLHGSIRLRQDWPDGACFELSLPIHA